MNEQLKGGFAADGMKHDLLEKIASGQLQPGERILSERKLAEAYGISYMTVRKAIGELVEQGCLRREAHRGVFVSEGKQVVFERPSRPQVLAFVTQDLYGEVVIEMLAAIERRARRSGYLLMVCNSMLDVTIERAHLENMLRNQVAGVVLFPCAGNANVETIRKLNRSGIPVVTIDNVCAAEDVDSVDCNNVDLAFKATEHLIECGHRHIGYITVSKENFRTNYVAQKRLEGFKAALDKHGLSCRTEDIAYLPWEYTSLPLEDMDLDNLGYEQAMTMLKGENRPTAIFVMFDEIALGVYRAAEELKLRIPEDLSVVGINGLDLCTRLRPMLTSVAQPFKVLGLRAVEILLLRLGGQQGESIKEELTGTLVRRKSVCQLTKR